MYRLILLSITYVVVQASASDRLQMCARFTEPETLACCNKQFPILVSIDDIAECFQMPMKPPSCDRDICIATKAGYASSDGTVDKKKLTQSLENLLKDAPTSLRAIKENCIEGDLSKYGPPDFCDLMKMHFCVDMQIVADCPQWDEDGDCKGTKDAAQDCVKFFS